MGCGEGRAAGDPGAPFEGEYNAGTPEGGREEDDEDGVKGGRGV